MNTEKWAVPPGRDIWGHKLPGITHEQLRAIERMKRDTYRRFIDGWAIQRQRTADG